MLSSPRPIAVDFFFNSQAVFLHCLRLWDRTIQIKEMKRYIINAILCLMAFSCMTACGKDNPEDIDDGPDKPFDSTTIYRFYVK